MMDKKQRDAEGRMRDLAEISETAILAVFQKLFDEADVVASDFRKDGRNPEFRAVFLEAVRRMQERLDQPAPDGSVLFYDALNGRSW